MKLEQVDNIFTQNMAQLQENYDKKRKVKAIQHIQEKKVCREMESKIKKQK